MKDTIIVKDDFCDHFKTVIQSALESGFSTVTPANAEMGSKSYEGMGFLGRHDLMLRALVTAHQRPVFPGAMFFRSTKPGMEESHVHSDRMHGDWTCIAYLSEHEEVTGTGFYRHKRTKWTELPQPEKLKEYNLLEKMEESMRKDEDWEQTDFVRGKMNRALIFYAPLFHARLPKDGLGDGTDKASRLTWVCHYTL